MTADRTGRRNGAAAALTLAAGLALLALGGCETSIAKVQEPAAGLYTEGTMLEDQGFYSEAVTKFQQVVEENPGTLLGSHGYLRLAELYAKQEKWVEADTNYRLFLTYNATSHLTSYVLYRLLYVNHQRSYTGLIFREREIDRDMEPNRRLILEYKRFFLLYPNSVYTEETLPFYVGARQTLARYEEMVGDFYFDRSQYNAAAHRYYYLLLHHPEFTGSDRVLDKLVRAYRENQQPGLAAEMDRIRRARGGQAPPGAAPESPADVGRTAPGAAGADLTQTGGPPPALP